LRIELKVEDDNGWRRIMEQGISAEELRSVARFVEEGLVALADISDISFPLVSGGLREFPRQTPEGEAFEQGVEALREDAEEAAAALRALAEARDNEIPVHPALLAPVQPYIDAFQSTPEQSASENGSDQTEGNITT
jgi:hypothetical protein